MGIFDRRDEFKPFEYPDLVAFKEAIQHSYWLVSEWNFLSDVHDFHVNLDDVERSAIRNTLLAISQIEVSVKRFWGKLGDRLPKPEIDQVGAVFAESEVRHADAYSHLLQVLGLNDDFGLLLRNPVIQGRVDYLTKYLKGAADNGDQGFALTLALFAIFIENVSLFSQFAIIKAFNKHKNLLKDVDNVVQATQKEELIHAMFGVAVLGHVQREHPDWFDDGFFAKLRRASLRAYEAECRILDWIFEAGELPFLPVATLREFLKDRFNASVAMLGGGPVFAVDAAALEGLRWFNEEIYAETSTDFFHKKPVTYSRKTKAITAGDLF